MVTKIKSFNLNKISGDSLYKDLEQDFNRASTVRKEIANALYHRSDPDQLRKFKDLFLEYLFSYCYIFVIVETSKYSRLSRNTSLLEIIR